MLMLSYYLALIAGESSSSLFEQVYLAHRHSMLYTAKCILHDQMLAEDATHDAFLRIMNHLDRITDPKSDRTRYFVVLIVRNIALDYCRKAERLCETSYDAKEFSLTGDCDSPEECFIQNESIENMEKAISDLNPTYTFVLTLKYLFDCSNTEIAEMMNISNDKVSLLLCRARKQLKIRCSQEDEVSLEDKDGK
jgi:RNA polymerase sigma-70 factor (ECF subfamily)